MSPRCIIPVDTVHQYSTVQGGTDRPCAPTMTYAAPHYPRLPGPQITRSSLEHGEDDPAKSQACHSFGEWGKGGMVGQGGWSCAQHHAPPVAPAPRVPDPTFCWGKSPWALGMELPHAGTGLQVTTQGDRGRQDQTALPPPRGVSLIPLAWVGSLKYPMSPSPVSNPHHSLAHQCQVKATVTPSVTMLHRNWGAGLEDLPDARW